MFKEGRYSNTLTVLLVIVMIAIIILLIFLGINVFNKYNILKDAEDAASGFNDKVPDVDFDEGLYDDAIGNYEPTNNTLNNGITGGNALANLVNPGTSSGSSGSGSSSSGLTYKGFPMIGTITISKTDVNLPILAKVSKESIEVSVAKQYGPDLNQPGNVVIIGHNYRNGLFFSNNKKLEVGDKINIKDRNGITLTYTIYSKFETDENDASFYDRDTNGKCEITLSTCTDNDATRRLILLARAE